MNESDPQSTFAHEKIINSSKKIPLGSFRVHFRKENKLESEITELIRLLERIKIVNSMRPALKSSTLQSADETWRLLNTKTILIALLLLNMEGYYLPKVSTERITAKFSMCMCVIAII